jgi:hypothetical protein
VGGYRLFTKNAFSKTCSWKFPAYHDCQKVECVFFLTALLFICGIKVLQKIINIIFERDLAWKEKYEQYFFDGDQQFYTKEFMIEHNML